MFNPFRGSIFDAVVAELVASVDRSPRVVRLILRNGASHDRLIRSGRFALVRTSLGLRPGPRVAGGDGRPPPSWRECPSGPGAVSLP